MRYHCLGYRLGIRGVLVVLLQLPQSAQILSGISFHCLLSFIVFGYFQASSVFGKHLSIPPWTVISFALAHSLHKYVETIAQNLSILS